MAGQPGQAQLAENLNFRCCRTEVEVYRCGHTAELPVQCLRVIGPNDLISYHMITHRVRVDVTRMCDNCHGNYITMEFRHQTMNPTIPVAGSYHPNFPGAGTHYQNAPVARAVRHPNAPFAGPVQHEDAPVAGAAHHSNTPATRPAHHNAPSTTAQPPVEARDTAEAEETSTSSEPEDDAEPYVANNLQPQGGRRLMRVVRQQQRDEKMLREFAERPPRRRGHRGG